MAEYLLYCFEGGEVVECDVFFAPGDREAIEGASTRHDGRAAQLWSGSRKVETFAEAADRLRQPVLATCLE